MDLKAAFKKLEENPEFNKWHKENKDAYFSYAFKIPQEMDLDDWQLGFYDNNKDKITTFVIEGNHIKMRPEEEVFKKEQTKVNEVKIDKIRLTFDNALTKASQFQQKKFPKDKSIKTIAILQNLNNLGNIWNITYITETFNTLNIRIDASNGKIVEHNLSSVFSFGKE